MSPGQRPRAQARYEDRIKQLQLPDPPRKPPSAMRAPEHAAKIAVIRRAKPSPVAGHVKLALTLELERDLAERLSARAIREGKNFEAIIVELLRAEME